MRRRTAAIVGVALALALGAAGAPGAGVAAAPQAPAPPAAGQLARGKAVFDEWCAGCHSRGPRNPGTQALQALHKGSKPAALEDRTDLVPKLTEAFVRKGVSVMPPFRKTEISDAQLADLAAYLAPKAR
jgi:mono/diheme cytochrome c family protein